MRENRRLFLGDLPLAEDIPWNGWGQAPSWVAVCPSCGKAWAKLESGSDYIPLRLPCWYHGDGYRIGGSLLSPFLWWEPETPLSRFLLTNPKWLKHEFEIHLSYHQAYDPPSR